MQKIINQIKKKLKINFDTHLNELNDLEYFGSRFAGNFIPKNFLNETSVCYCVGAGNDISFDTELVVNFNAKIYIFDPAPEGIKHFNMLIEASRKKEKITLGTHPHTFTYRASYEQLNDIHFEETGLWDKQKTIRFYKPTVDDYPSYSIDLFSDSKDFIVVPVDRLSKLMEKLNHQSLDLLKLEIEGAEYVVLETIIKDKLDIKMILVEYDEVYHPKDYKYLFRIKKSTESLIAAGYVLAHSTPQFKRLFIRNDFFNQLKAK